MDRIYKELVDSAVEGLIYQNSNGEIEAWNKGAENIFGLEVGDAAGQTSLSREWSLVYKDGSPCPEEKHPSMITLATGRPLSSEMHGIELRDGSITWVSISTRPVFGPGSDKPRAVVVSFSEIGELIARQLEHCRAADVLKHLPIGLFIFRYEPPNRLILVQGNPASQGPGGVRTEEWIGHLIQEIWPQTGESGLASELIKVVGTGQPYQTEYCTYSEGKLEGVFKIRAFALPEDHLAVVFENESEKRRVEESLKHNETMLRTLFDNMSNGVAIYEAVDGGRDFIIKDLNRAGLAAAQKSKEEVIGKSVREAFPGVVELGLFKVFQRVWETGLPEAHPTSMYSDDKLNLWVENYVFKLPGGEVIAVYEDTTERHRAEVALRDSEEKFRTITEQMAETVFVTDEDGRIEYISPVAREIFGYRAEEMVGSHFARYLAMESIDEALQSFSRSLSEGAAVNQLSLRMKRRDGSVFLGELTGRPYLRGGRVVGTIGIIRDESERKRSEEALLLSEEKFAKAFHKSPMWVVLSSLKEGTYLEVNDFFLELTGYTREEVIGRTSVELGTWASPQTRVRIIEKIREQGFVRNMEVERLDRQGKKLQMLFSGEVITIGGEELLLSVSQDVTARKLMEEELRASEERFSLFAQNIPGLVYIKDHLGRYLFMNEKCSEFFRYTGKSLIGKTSFDIFPPDKAELYTRSDQRILKTGRAVTSTEEVTGADGRPAFMMNRKFLIKRKDRSPLIGGIYLDMTDRVQAEEALRKSEEKMRSIFLAAPIGIGLVTDRFLMEVNDGFCSMVGYQKEELVGKSTRMLFPTQEEYDRVGTDMYPQIERTGKGTIETRYLRKDGQIINVAISSTRLDPGDPAAGITFATQDITESKRVQKEIKEAHKLLLTILNGIEYHIYVADMETHEILFINQSMKESFGLDPTGEPCYRIFRGEEGPCSYCTNPQLVDDRGRPTKGIVWEGPNPVTERWYINYDRAVEWVDGRVVRLQVASDITELKQAEKEKENLQSQLRQAQKMEAVGTLAGGIAHDFNNLLTAILGYSELALDDALEGVSNARQIQEIIKAGHRAKDLITQILTFSRKLEPELKPINLNKVVFQTEKMLERIIPKMIQIEMKMADDLWLINADVGQLSQVILNLGSNARDAMPEGGRLLIETENITLDQRYCDQHAGAVPGPYVLFSVSDTGHGMDRETMEHIFDPFFTQKEIGQGTGLGLATVYGVVKSHNGYIMCYSEPGKGTTFRIYLPVLESAERDDPEPKADQGLWEGEETILLVDDEEAIRDLGEQILTRRGYKVLLAETGEQALEVYGDRGADIDLVLLDISMPGMGGRRCLEELLKLDPEARVIIASGYSLNGQSGSIVSMGARAFVAKPFFASGLLSTIRRVLDGESKAAKG